MPPTKDTRIADLLAVPTPDHDLAWLIQSLQVAVELELATLPPYLCAFWSVPKPESSEAATLILSVIFQEMLHMGLAANMLTTIGGTPTIDTAVPTYPGGLPGGVRPQLTVTLGGLTKAYVHDVFMQIEYPEGGPLAAREGPATIGAFYGAIWDTFRAVKPPITGANQQTATIGKSGHFTNTLYAITSLADVEKAITEIKEQGEGTTTSPDAPQFGDELAHFYRFGEIYHGHRFVKTDGHWGYTGDPVPFPTAYPMATVPKGGWPSPPAAVATLLTTFDCLYQSVLTNLQSAWTGGSGALNAAINDMFGLATPAIALMQITGAPGGGSYGPDFIVPAPGTCP